MTATEAAAFWIDPTLLGELEQGHIPAFMSREFLARPLDDFAARSQRVRTPHIAELFHENSKNLSQPEPSEIDAVREWFFRSTYTLSEDMQASAQDLLLSHESLPATIQSLVRPFAQEGYAANLLFAVDLLVIWNGQILRQLPRRPSAWRDGSVARREGLPDSTAWLAVVAVPWRHMCLDGPRGYRKALLDAGATLDVIRQAAECPICISLDYCDFVVDAALALDGLERSVVALVDVGTIQ